MSIKCGKCIACIKFDGSNGSGYQPCHNLKRPVPPVVPTPPIQIVGGSDTEPNEQFFLKAMCVISLLIGVVIGIYFERNWLLI